MTRIFLPAATKIRLMSTILFAFLLCASNISLAQTETYSDVKVIAFGITDTGRIIRTTYDQIINNRVLSAPNKDGKITDFQISYVVSEGKDPFKGPYSMKGREVTDEFLDMMMKLKKAGANKTRVFIENIHVMRNGQQETAKPISFVCNAN
jgi:hypothetical protein